MAERFEAMLTGGHPNSLGRTIEVVDTVLADPARFGELYDCYGSEDEIVRLRVSNAMKRVEKERHELLVPYIDGLITEIGDLDQASAQWTLADLFFALEPDMDAAQKAAALAIMKRNLAEHHDWIVLNRTMDTLLKWVDAEDGLADWMAPHLERLANDPRKSVAKRASKGLAALGAG
ncbi:MAG: hypothetical protein AAFO72_00410 [Pseudomonadota bacterium]